MAPPGFAGNRWLQIVNKSGRYGFLVKTDNKGSHRYGTSSIDYSVVQFPSAFRYEKWFRDRGGQQTAGFNNPTMFPGAHSLSRPLKIRL
jgi:hypothetical protein